MTPQQSVLRSITRFAGTECGSGKKLRTLPRVPETEFDEFAVSWGGGEGSQKLTAGMISRILSAADEGSASAQAALFRTVLEKEPSIATHLQTRVLAVLACDWSIRGDDERKVREVETILRNAGIRELLRHLLDALAFGYSGSAVLWDEGGASIRSFRHIHPMNWSFDLAGNPALLTLSGHERALADYHRNQFIFHRHSLKTEIPSRGGLLRPLIWLYFFKHYAMRDRARYLERFGIPFLIAKIRNEDFESESVRTTIMDSLSKLGSDGLGLLSEGADVQLINSSAGSSSAEYQSWLDYLDRLFAQMILGQTATSGDGSGFSRGQAQENVRRDLIEADCRNLMETVNRRILAPLERFRYGSEGTLRFDLDYSSPENLLEKAQIVKVLAESGYQVSPAWIQKTFSIQLESQSGKDTPTC